MPQLIVPFWSEATGWSVDIDGVTYRPALVDSAGHVQVDVLSAALPTGAATLAEQQAQTTALRLIDDLRNALATVSADTLLVSLDAKGSLPRLGNENYAAAQTNNELVAAPGASKRLILTGVFFSTDTAGTFKLTQSSGSPADVFGPHYFPDNGGISAPTMSAPILLNLNSALRVTTDIAGNHTITVLVKEV